MAVVTEKVQIVNQQFPNVTSLITEKVQILNQELPKVVISLQEISLQIQTLARSYLKNNFVRATELATIGSKIKIIIGSTLLILNNLQKDELHMSLAICASRGVKDELKTMIEILSLSLDTSTIDCTILINVSKVIDRIAPNI